MSTIDRTTPDPRSLHRVGYPSDPSLAACLDYLARDDVLRICRATSSSTMTEQRLQELPMPAGLSMSDTRALLHATSRLHAVTSPVPDHHGRVYWMSVNREILLKLRLIDRHCSSGSRLHERVIGKSHKKFLIRTRVDEAITTARLDGVDVSYEVARDLLMTERQPANDGERVIVNCHRALQSLEELAQEVWTPAFLVALYDLARSGTESAPFDPKYSRAPESAVLSPSAVLDMICEYANGEVLLHPAITATVLAEIIHHWLPFPGWNGAVADLAFRLVAIRNDYPVLGFLPLSRTTQRWREGRIPYPEVTQQPSEIVLAVNDRFQEVDYTTHISLALELVALALSDLQENLEAAGRRDEELRKTLHAKTGLNHRQRSILGRAIRVPDATFQIRYHQKAHGIAYATAHGDLLGLVEMGYLIKSQEFEGAPFIFRAAGDLRERLKAPGE